MVPNSRALPPVPRTREMSQVKNEAARPKWIPPPGATTALGGSHISVPLNLHAASTRARGNAQGQTHSPANNSEHLKTSQKPSAPMEDDDPTSLVAAARAAKAANKRAQRVSKKRLPVQQVGEQTDQNADHMSTSDDEVEYELVETRVKSSKNGGKKKDASVEPDGPGSDVADAGSDIEVAAETAASKPVADASQQVPSSQNSPESPIDPPTPTAPAADTEQLASDPNATTLPNATSERSLGGYISRSIHNLLGNVDTRSDEEIAREMHQQERMKQQRRLERQREEHVAQITMRYTARDLAYEVINRGDKLGNLEAVLEDRMKTIRNAESRELSLGKQLQESERKAEEIQKELAASRAFVESEDAGDVGSLIKGLQDISASIDDMSFEITESLPPILDSTNMSSDLANLINSSHPHFFALARACHKYKRSVQDFLLPAICSHLLMSIQNGIFEPFKIGLGVEKDKYLWELYRGICASEPQDRAARWRSITYERCVPSSPQADQHYSMTIASDILTSLVALIALVIPSESKKDVDLSERQQPILDIVLKALEWRTRTRKGYLSHDYEPFVGPHRSKSSSGGKGEPVALSGFGLLSRRSVLVNGRQGGKDQIRVEEKCLGNVGVLYEKELEVADGEEGESNNENDTTDDAKDGRMEE